MGKQSVKTAKFCSKRKKSDNCTIIGDFEGMASHTPPSLRDTPSILEGEQYTSAKSLF